MSRNKFLSLLLCQLIWIFPIAFFLISFSSETVILSDSKSPSFYGPFKVFDDHELEQLKKIDENWSEFEISMKENFNQKGLMQPWDKSCFIWIPECYYIAKHQTIIQVKMPSLCIYSRFVGFLHAKQQQNTTKLFLKYYMNTVS